MSVLRWGDVADAADGILVTVRRGKTNQEGETKDVRFVKAGVARALRSSGPPRARRRMTRSCRSRRRWWGCGLRAAARAAGVERRNRPLGAGRTGVGAEGVDHRRDARRELEDEPDGRALLGRGDRRAGGLWRGISEPWSTSSPAHRPWSTDPSESVTGLRSSPTWFVPGPSSPQSCRENEARYTATITPGSLVADAPSTTVSRNVADRRFLTGIATASRGVRPPRGPGARLSTYRRRWRRGGRRGRTPGSPLAVGAEFLNVGDKMCRRADELGSRGWRVGRLGPLRPCDECRPSTGMTRSTVTSRRR